MNHYKADIPGCPPDVEAKHAPRSRRQTPSSLPHASHDYTLTCASPNTHITTPVDAERVAVEMEVPGLDIRGDIENNPANSIEPG